MHNPPRILVADDNQDNRDILAAQLASEKYELLQAADGEAALIVRQKSPSGSHTPRYCDAEARRPGGVPPIEARILACHLCPSF